MKPLKTVQTAQPPPAPSLGEQLALGAEFMDEYGNAFEALAKDVGQTEPSDTPPL